MPRRLGRRLLQGLVLALLQAIGYGTLRPVPEPPFEFYVPWAAHLMAFFLLGLAT